MAIILSNPMLFSIMHDNRGLILGFQVMIKPCFAWSLAPLKAQETDFSFQISDQIAYCNSQGCVPQCMTTEAARLLTPLNA
jgi:hypothetical protein